MNEQCNMLIDYFNRTLTDEEMTLFEQHLIECPACAEELAEWEMLTEDLPFSSDEIEVPSDLKARIFEQIDEVPVKEDSPKVVQEKAVVVQPKKRFNFALPALAAALLVSLISNIYLVNESNKAPEVAQSDIQFIGKTVLASEPGAEDASAVAMLLSDQGEDILIVDAEGMPALPEGELYQVWVIEGDVPYPAGVIELTDKGEGSVNHRLTDLDGDWDTIAITVETKPNLPLPEGSVVMAGGI